MAQKLEALRTSRSAAARGLGLELFLAELFGREHFRVEKNLVADGRQIDLFVIRGDMHLLVEAKWTTRRSQHDVIDEMQARLKTAPPGVVGLLVSISGFSAQVIKRVESSAGSPILLMDGSELESVVSRGDGLYSLVRSKRDLLLRERRVAVGLPRHDPSPWLTDLPEAGLRLVDLKGREHRWWESRGEFSEVVNPLRRPDPEWAREGGVRLDMALGARDADDLVTLLTRLAQLGWISSEGAWRFEQSGTVWSGLGAAEFARQLTDWEPRYKGRRMHHSELAMYVDDSDDGVLTLAADLSATPGRLLRWCELSFMLGGIPLDVSPYDALLAELPVIGAPSFRILSQDPAHTDRLVARGKPRRADPVGFLVRDEPIPLLGEGPQRWVEGIIVADRIARTANRSGLLPGFRSNKVGNLFVQLRQHHRPEDKVSYEALLATQVQGACLSLLHVMGDWQWSAGLPGDHAQAQRDGRSRPSGSRPSCST